jgi:plastocyanin
MAITRKEFLKLGTLGLVGGVGLALSSAVGAKKRPTRTVLIQGFKFKPAHITIKRGTKVRWINKDRAHHTATATKRKSFDSGQLGKGQRYTHLQEHGQEEVLLRDTSLHEGKRHRQTVAVDEGSIPTLKRLV